MKYFKIGFSQAELNRRKSEEEKRLLHTLSERNRRKTVNDSFANLKSKHASWLLIPRFTSYLGVLPDFSEVDKPIKMEVLKNAKQYIVSLTKETESLEKEVQFLLDQAEDLGLDRDQILADLKATEEAEAEAEEANHYPTTITSNNISASGSSGSSGSSSSSSSSYSKNNPKSIVESRKRSRVIDTTSESKPKDNDDDDDDNDDEGSEADNDNDDDGERTDNVNDARRGSRDYKSSLERSNPSKKRGSIQVQPPE